jgi:hypothetical protein
MSPASDPRRDTGEEGPGRPVNRTGPDEEIDPGWPWSFLLLVAAGALYLIFRFVELGLELFN